MASFGFNFRQTLAYLTDPSDTAAITSTPTTRYPTSLTIGASSYTVGYVGGTAPDANNTLIESQSRNRSLAVDARLAGVFQVGNNNRIVFRFTLPTTGTYRIRLACGDAVQLSNPFLKIYDNATLLSDVLTGTSVPSGSFADATGVNRTAAAWPAGNAYVDLTFATTTAFVYLGNGDGVTSGTSSEIAHISFEFLPPSFSINSTNSGANDLNAGAVNTAGVTGYVVGVNPVVSGTVGSLALTSVSQATTIATFTIPSPVNDSYYPQPDTSHILTLTDGSNPATFNAVMNSLDGYTSIVLASPDLADTHKIPYWLTSTAVDDDRIMYKTADMTVSADGGISGATLGATTIYYHWRVADSKIYAYEALLDEEGVVVSTPKPYFIGLGIGIGFGI